MVSAPEFVTLALTPVGTLLLFWWLTTWRWRRHVWADIELQEGKAMRRRFRPDKDGIIETRWGNYFTHPHALSIFRGKPMFRYKQGDPFPIRYDTKKVVSENPGTVIEVANAERVVIPAPALAVFMKQKLFADAYANRFGMMLLLLLGLAVVAMLVIGLYIRK